ncbi:potassium transporter [Stereum hirsutum FP-91666 SS1]|uniref:potassium transporter n=1 Tax=Stereum hirsutum (strain FP-91666) TaxID=721885 RepID=UPI000444A8D3|nr:potassium transporter [Stereum hirsutum FP-91666 SS1]EIM80921.1 potassium transporter [Stereum hirsutum FP-91666 SS1]
MHSSPVDVEDSAFHGGDKLKSEAHQTACLEGNPSADISSSAETRRMSTVKSRWGLLALSFQTLGIIYSDVGTSPVYTMNGLWPATGPVPSAEDVVGGISAIVWALTIIPLVKYVFVALRFGTSEGEGGIFALYQGLYPYTSLGVSDVVANISPTDPCSPKPMRKRRIPPPCMRWPLLIWALFGTSLTMADGVFTAAVSVTSAVGGIAVAKPEVFNSVVPISIGFLLVLFLAQPFGTHRLSVAFAPVTGIWLLIIAGSGICNITQYPGIWRAFDPSRAIMYFVRTGNYDLLAGVLLALTGCEAMFASLGHFNMRSIQISFSTIVYPCLILAYLGQGARIVVDGEAVMSNIFFLTVPGKANGPLFWVIYVFAILATLIASQTMITATFSLIQQLVNMKNLPAVRMVHTSNTIRGQIYVPAANWILMTATIIVVAVFKDATQLTNAYGFAVSTVMFTTTVLITIQISYVKQLPIAVALLYFVTYGFFDGLFWGASLKKIPEGAWVPLMMGSILWILMAFWDWVKGLEEKFDGSSRQKLEKLIVRGRDPSIGQDIDDEGRESDVQNILREVTKYFLVQTGGEVGSKPWGSEKTELVRLPIVGVFHKMANERGVPHSFISFVRQWPALPKVVIFLSFKVLPLARVPIEDRYTVETVDLIPGVYIATYHVGFRQGSPVEVSELVERICALESRSDPRELISTDKNISAVSHRYTHIVPHYEIISKQTMGVGLLSPAVNCVRRFLIQDIYGRLCVMFPEATNWIATSDE